MIFISHHISGVVTAIIHHHANDDKCSANSVKILVLRNMVCPYVILLKVAYIEMRTRSIESPI